MTVRINKQKINLREKLAGAEDKVNFDEVVRGLGEYTGNIGIGTTSPDARLNVAYRIDDLNDLFQETIRVRGDWTSVGSGPAITFTN